MENPEIDNHKLMYHPGRVSDWEKTGDCFPIYVEIGATNRCNHRCIFCALDFLERGGFDIPSNVLIENLEDMALHGVKSVMFAGEGESTLHKNLSDFVRISKNNGIDVAITTNGAALNEKKIQEILPYLSWIRFSVDAGEQNTYAKIHGTKKEDFDKVIKNIEYASKLKIEEGYTATIGVQALLIKDNVDEIEKLARIVKEKGADNLQIKPYSHHPSSQNDLSVDYTKHADLKERLESFNDSKFKVVYREQTMKRIVNGRDYQDCLGLPFFALIDARGNVIPCNMFYNNPEFSYGNINERLFSEIWLGDKRKDVLNKIKERGTKDCRVGCRLDVINSYLDKLKNPGSHDNFI
jgi:radical SAM protein with 4Fe4S-binding SPASM domain